MIAEPTETATFPQRVMSLLDEDEVQQCMYWLPNGLAFEIHNPELFEEIVLKAHFNSIKLDSFVIRLRKWGFTRMDKKCNSRYISYTFASELFRRDQPHLCLMMKLKNKREKTKSRPSKSEANEFDGKKALPMPTPSAHMPVIVFKPVPVVQIHPANPMMIFSLGHPSPQPMAPSYPPPPRQFKQWQVPRSHMMADQDRIPPPPSPPIVHKPIHEPRIPPPELYHRQDSDHTPPMVRPPRIAPPVHHHQPRSYVPQGQENKVVKRDYKRSNKESKKPLQDRLSGIEMELKTEYKQKAEAAVAMMDLANTAFSYRGQIITE